MGHSHPYPSLPGWKILVRAALALSHEPHNQFNRDRFIAQCVCRTDEFIPEEHRDQVAKAVFAAGTAQQLVAVPDVVTDFLFRQFGHEAIREMVRETAGEWMILPRNGVPATKFRLAPKRFRHSD